MHEKDAQPDMTPVIVHITRKCLVGGRTQAPGAQCVIPMNDAVTLRAMGYADILRTENEVKS